MKQLISSKQTYNEMLFAGRNKAYGAYALRESYELHLRKAALIMLAVVSSLLLLSFIKPSPTASKNSADPLVKISEVKIEPIVLPKKKVLPIAQQQRPARKVAHPSTTPAHVVSDHLVKEPSKLFSNHTAINSIGDTNTYVFPITDFKNPIGTETDKESTKPFKWVEKMPEFPGGNDELMSFLATHIHYTSEARHLELDGKVVVTFIVDAEGQISSIEVLKQLGGGLDQEAVSAVSKMPKWNPGIQNGKKVPVQFTLPINFELH